MAKAAALVRAEESIASTLAAADQIVTLTDANGRAAQQELLRVLQAADEEVAKRLLKVTRKADGSIRFTEAQAINYQTQIRLVIEKVQGKLEPLANGVADAAMKKSVQQGAKLLATLEKDFKGVTASPNIIAAIQSSQVLHGTKANAVTSIATSVDRYGLEMGKQFSHIIQVGLVSGATTDQMIEALVNHGGPRGRVSIAAKETAEGVVERLREEDIPEGLFVRHRYWAERIVRTECAKAFNGAKLEQLYAMRREGLDVLKKICATFDKRTAADSVFVHGQVRKLEDTFLDGKGRVYVAPPGRPNDRETILPWFADWADTPSTEPATPKEQAEAKELVTAPPAPTNAPLVPRNVEEVKKLEHEVETEVQKQEAQAAGEHAAQQSRAPRDGRHGEPAAEVRGPEPQPASAAPRGRVVTPDHRAGESAVDDAETEAATVLERLRRERSEKIVAIQKAAEEQRARDAAEANARADRDVKRIDKTVEVKLKSEEPYRAELELHAIAAENPRAFARYVNTKRSTVLPEASLLGALVSSTKGAQEVKAFMIRDALGSYAADPAVTLTVEALEAFKRADLHFDVFRGRLARSRSPRSIRTLASLLSSEGMPWHDAMRLAKTPDKALREYDRLRARHSLRP